MELCKRFRNYQAKIMQKTDLRVQIFNKMFQEFQLESKLVHQENIKRVNSKIANS